ncbi:MAG TPA: NADH-quinone oxidoreductase subunit C, partial [Cryptosporangiaceae bacterium]|nr:NADH-quinone oxidoreductase subunit C [Cryptosporangiaceae bacterium]
MTPEEVAQRLVDAVGVGQPSVSDGAAYRRACVDLPSDAWVGAATTARDVLDLRFFDWLTAVDEGEAGYAVVAHLWSLTGRYGALLRTVVSREASRLATLVGVFPGASWHERETFEMFGIDFVGHPNLVKLLLPDEFDGHPLRKDFVLASRVVKPWPGAKEPGESDATAPSRRRMLPPGVPDPNDWGPTAGSEPVAERPTRVERPARTERPERAARPE